MLGYTGTVSVCSKGSNHEIRLRPYTDEAHNQGIKKKKGTFLHLDVYNKRITSAEICTKQVHLQVERRHFDIG